MAHCTSSEGSSASPQDSARGVPGSKVNPYAEMCSGPSAIAARASSSHCSSVCPGSPHIRSRFKLAQPASRMARNAFRAAFALCSRPSVSSIPSCSDCTPSEIRLTPAARNPLAFSAVCRESGLASMLISAPGNTSNVRPAQSSTPAS